MHRLAEPPDDETAKPGTLMPNRMQGNPRTAEEEMLKSLASPDAFEEHNVTVAPTPYPIGTPGVPWGVAERALWLSRQTRHRGYEAEVLSVIERLRSRFDIVS